MMTPVEAVSTSFMGHVTVVERERERRERVGVREMNGMRTAGRERNDTKRDGDRQSQRNSQTTGDRERMKDRARETDRETK